MKMGEIWKSMWHFTKRNTKSWHQPAIQSEQMQGPVLLWAMQSVLPLRTLSGYLEVEEQETPYTKGLLSQLLYWKEMLPWSSQDSGAHQDYNSGVAMVSSDTLIKKQHIIINWLHKQFEKPSCLLWRHYRVFFKTGKQGCLNVLLFFKKYNYFFHSN